MIRLGNYFANITFHYGINTMKEKINKTSKRCPNCHREILSDKWLLKNGKCKWCDFNYYLKRTK